MLSGLEFLKLACGSNDLLKYKFDPFGEVEKDILEYTLGFEEVVSYLDVGTNPRPAPMPPVELKHPRPVHRIALMDAYERFEEIAWSEEHTKCKSLSAYSAQLDGVVLSQDDKSPLPVSERAVGSPKRASGVKAQPHSSAPVAKSARTHQATHAAEPRAACLEEPPLLTRGRAKVRELVEFYSKQSTLSLGKPKVSSVRESGGLACLSPGFLDHFSVNASQRGPPRPTFVLPRNVAHKATPLPSPIPTIASEYENEKDKTDEDDGLSYVSSFSDIGEVEASDSNSNSESLFGEQADGLEDAEYYSAAFEQSGYEVDGDASTNEQASPLSSTGSVGSSTSTSPASSTLSTISGASHEADVPTVGPESWSSGLQLRWTVGMPGDAVKYLVAAEHALKGPARGRV